MSNGGFGGLHEKLLGRVARARGPVTSIALFPLNIVLFPDGPLPLRIFETRYVDMVRRCHARGPRLRRGVDSRRPGSRRWPKPRPTRSARWPRSPISISCRTACSDLSCVGQQRFRIGSAQPPNGRPASGRGGMARRGARGARASAACALGGIAAHGAAAIGRGIHGHPHAARRCRVGGPSPGRDPADSARATSRAISRSTIPSSAWTVGADRAEGAGRIGHPQTLRVSQSARPMAAAHGSSQ